MNDVAKLPLDTPLCGVSSHLPASAVLILRRASGVDPTTPFGESKERACVMDEAIARVKRLYPRYFPKD